MSIDKQCNLLHRAGIKYSKNHAYDKQRDTSLTITALALEELGASTEVNVIRRDVMF